MLVVEYDVDPDGVIEVVAVILAEESDGNDPSGQEWKAWRDSHPDGGLGYVVVPSHLEAAVQASEDEQEIRSLIEALILSDRRTKESQFQGAPQ